MCNNQDLQNWDFARWRNWRTWEDDGVFHRRCAAVEMVKFFVQSRNCTLGFCRWEFSQIWVKKKVMPLHFLVTLAKRWAYDTGVFIEKMLHTELRCSLGCHNEAYRKGQIDNIYLIDPTHISAPRKTPSRGYTTRCVVSPGNLNAVICIVP